MGGVFSQFSDAAGEVGKLGTQAVKYAPEILSNAGKLGELVQVAAGKAGLPGVAKIGEGLAAQAGKYGARIINEAKDKTPFLEKALGKKVADLGKFNKDVKLVLSDGRQVKMAVTPILKYGQWVIKGMRATTGVGDPETGDRFSDGAEKFSKIGEVLHAASPSDEWEGTAADAYTDQNARQEHHAGKVGATDQHIKEILARQAQQVMHTRDGLDNVSDWLAVTSFACMALAVIPEVGEALQMAAEMLALEAGLAVATPLTMKMLGDANSNAAEVRRVSDDYREV